MSTAEPSQSLCLLTLPPEIRNLIYRYSFQDSQPLKLRSPSQRRLRPSRPAKDDTRGFLDTCRTVRNEAIALYYSLNALSFRSASDALAFISDPLVHPAIKPAITHVAIDFGDAHDADAILKDHISIVDRCVGVLPRLRALETRFYARSIDARASMNFHTLALAFDGLDADMNAPPSPRTAAAHAASGFDISAIQAQVMQQYCFTEEAATAFAKSKLKFGVVASSQHYPGVKHDKLICYNLKMASEGMESVLGKAKEAVRERVKMVGMLPLKLREMYDTAVDGGFHQRVRSSICTAAN